MKIEDLALGARPSGRTLISARWIVAFADGGHRLLEDGEVVLEGGDVLFVGKHFSGEVARRIDFGEALISPGFIDLDALSDLDTTLLGVDHQPGWAKGRVWPRSYLEAGPYEMYSEEELAFQKRFAFAQLLMNGITTALPIASLFYRSWGETVSEFEAAVDAAGEMGLRVYLGPAYRAGGMICDGPGQLEPVFDEARGIDGLEASVSFISAQSGRHGGLVQGLLAPDRVETCTQVLLVRTMAAAEDLDVPVRLHMAQGDMERDVVQRLHGMTGPEWLHSFDALSSRLIAPHATHATDRDLSLYADHGVSIAHCPLVVARNGAALRSLPKCRSMGIRVGLGTDTAPPDMVLNMAIAVMMGRAVDGASDCITSSEVFEAATLGGADALGRTDIGRIEKGSKADIAVFDLRDTRIAPAIDPIETLILGATGRITKAVFVDGSLSMRNVVVAGLNLDAARVSAQEQFDRLVSKYPERTLGHPALEEIFPSSFPKFPQ